MIEHLKTALDWSPAYDASNLSLSAMQESALLYTGHLSVILLAQNPAALAQEPMLKILSLSA